MELDQFKDVNLVIDKANDIFIQRQFVSQGDYKGRTLTVQITNNGSIGEVPGLTLNLNWHNEASGLTDLTAFTILDKKNSIFRIEYPENMMTPGKVYASIQIIQDGKVTNLKQFELIVQELAGQPVGIIEKAEFSALVAVLADSNKFRTDIDSLSASKADKNYINDYLSKVTVVPETFTNLAAIQAKYPNGANGVMVAADNGHKYIWANNVWTDAGVYQAVGIAESDRTDAFGTLYSTLGDINKTVTGSFGKKIQFSAAYKAASTDSVNYEIDNYGVTTLTFNRTGNWVFLESQLGDFSKIKGEHLTVIFENTGTYNPQDFNILLSNTGDWSGSFKNLGSVVFENGVFKVEFDVTSDNLGFTPDGSVHLIVRNLGVNDVSQDISVKISASLIASSAYGNPNAFSLKALESAHSVQSDNSAKSDFAKSAESAENVGIKPLINSISSSSPYVDCTRLNATDFKVSKDYSKESQPFPKIVLEVDYNSIDDLDENFILKITDNNPTSSEGTKAAPNVFYILSENADWNSLWHPINFSEGTYNLKSLISSSAYSDYYSSAKKLYILVGFYMGSLSDSTTYGNMFFDVNITAIIENSAAVLVATGLSSSLQEKINSESQYVNEIVCWGDSLTAMGGWTEKLATLTNMDVQNGGTGGETVRTIAARQGADIMTVNNITIPADTSTAVEVGTKSTGISTQFGYSATPLFQGGDNHVNPVKIGNIEGTLAWTGSSSSDTAGVWNFTRNAKGNATIINRVTPLRTYFDRAHNNPYLMIIFMGQNGGYTDNDDLVRMHKLMIEHSHAKNVLILGMHTGTASSRGDYETAMENEFGRKFFSLRQYLAHPVYGTDGKTIKSCWGLDDSGLTPTSDDLAKIEVGQVPLQLLLDGTHYTTATREVVGNAIYNYLVGLNLF